MAATPWGELRIDDAHIHFFSHAFYSGLARQKQLPDAEALGPLLGWEIPPADPAALATRWVEELDANGVSRACLIGSAPGDEASVAAAVSRYPDRFFGHFMLDPLQPDAKSRMERAAADPHLHCVCLFPALHRFSMADAAVTTALEIAAEGRLAVFVHCGALSIGVRKKLGLPNAFDMRLSSPLDLLQPALKFPQVRFIAPHFGAGYFREALMLADQCPNVLLDTSSTNGWMKYDGLDLRSVFARSLDVLGPGRLLFGSDSSFFPRGWHGAILKQQAGALHSLGVNAGDAQRILSGNLEQLYA